jgi:hypothetical protein
VLRRARAVLLAAALLAPAAAAGATPPPIRHVFVIVLENRDFSETFGPRSKVPYLARTLAARGQMLTRYYATGHNSLVNYIALISGQAPNLHTQQGCTRFTRFALRRIDRDGQAIGRGCVFPASVRTVADQLSAHGLTWGGYMEDMADTPSAPKTCRHPRVGDRDPWQGAHEDDQYATRHNPFVYFRSIIDSPECALRNVDLDELPAALASGDVPSYVFITPDLCSDGHDEPCPDGRPGGYASMNGFLRRWVPRITGSSAYRDGGLLIVTFDEAEGGAESCCVDNAPNVSYPGYNSYGPGGGLTGAVLLSPFIRPGTKNDHAYNHYSLLRSVEDIFGLPALGYARHSLGFGRDVYNGPRCLDTPVQETTPEVPHGTLVRHVRRQGRRLWVRLARTSSLTVRTVAAGGRQGTISRTGFACRTLLVRLPRHPASATIVARKSGYVERRSLQFG